MSLIVIMSVYNEARAIGRAIDRVHDYVDEIHVWDGAYKYFPHVDHASNDGTREVAERREKVVWHPAPAVSWPDQIAKRTATLASAKAGDWIFILDADEFVANPTFLSRYRGPAPRTPGGNGGAHPYDVGWARIRSDLYENAYRAARLFRKVPGMHYAGRHYWIYDGKKRLLASHQHDSPHYRHADVELVIWNLRQSNGPDRESKKTEFRRQRNPIEYAWANENAVYSSKDSLVPHPERAGRPRRSFEVLRAPESPRYSLVVPFSRAWAVDAWFRMLDQLSLPADTEILAVVDSDDAPMYRRVKSLLFSRRARFDGVRCYFTGKPVLAEMRQVSMRRERIMANWHLFLTELVGEIVLGAEDDTLAPPHAYQTLLAAKDQLGAAFVQGTIVGRWNMPVIPHWRIAEDALGKVVRIESTLHDGDDVVPIDGGGWYCFAADAAVMRQFEMTWSVDPPMGPDIRHVWDIVKAGHAAYGHWGIKCEHVTARFTLHPDRSPLEKVSWTWHAKSGTWRQLVEKRQGAATPYTTRRKDVREAPEMSPEVGKSRVRALRTWSGAEGLVIKGTILDVTTQRCRELCARGFAEEWPDGQAPRATQEPAAAVAPEASAPAEASAASSFSRMAVGPEASEGAFECKKCGKRLRSEMAIKGHLGWHARAENAMLQAK